MVCVAGKPHATLRSRPAMEKPSPQKAQPAYEHKLGRRPRWLFVEALRTDWGLRMVTLATRLANGVTTPTNRFRPMSSRLRRARTH